MLKLLHLHLIVHHWVKNHSIIIHWIAYHSIIYHRILKTRIHRIHISWIIIWARILPVAAKCTLQRSAHRYIIWARVARMPGMFQGPWSNPILLEKHSHNTHSYLNGHFSSSSRSDEMPSEKVATKVATFILRNA